MATEKNWTDQEIWVWTKIKNDEIADLSIYSQGQPDKEILSPAFLEAIFKDVELKKMVKTGGVRIKNAQFIYKLNLKNITVDFPVWFDFCRFWSPVELYQARFGRYLSLEGSSFFKGVDMRSLQCMGLLNLDKISGPLINLTQGHIKGNVQISNSTKKIEKLILKDSYVEGSLIIQNSKVENINGAGMEVAKLFEISLIDSLKTAYFRKAILSGETIFNQVNLLSSVHLGDSKIFDLSIHNTKGAGFYFGSSVVGHNLTALETELEHVDLTQTTIKGNLFFSSSQFNSLLLFQTNVENSINIASCDIDSFNGFLLKAENFFSSDNSFNTEVNMGSFAGERLVGFNNSTFLDGLNLAGSVINGNLLLRGDSILGDLRINNIVVKGDIRLNNSCLQKATLGNSRISGSLYLTDTLNSHVKWIKSDSVTTYIDLSNLFVSQIRDEEKEWVSDSICSRTWPDSINLRGFKYNDIYFIDRDSQWYIEWLARSPYYKAQYDQLSDFLKTVGKHQASKAVAIKSGEELLKQSNLLSWRGVFLTFMSIVTAFGEDKLRTVYIMFGFVILGMIMLRIENKERKDLGLNSGFTYCLDRILPIITLERKFDKVYFETNWLRRYFYAHQLIGYLLVTLLLASLAEHLLI